MRFYASSKLLPSKKINEEVPKNLYKRFMIDLFDE